MSLDEPFRLVKKSLKGGELEERLAAQQCQFMQTATTMLANGTVGYSVEKPGNEPLQINTRLALDEKFQYLRSRRPNALQIFEAIPDLRIAMDLANCVNLQRHLECMQFDPVREWQYYPIVDSLLGMGVPRSFTNAPMLPWAQVAIQYRGHLAAFSMNDNTVIPISMTAGNQHAK